MDERSQERSKPEQESFSRIIELLSESVGAEFGQVVGNLKEASRLFQGEVIARLEPAVNEHLLLQSEKPVPEQISELARVRESLHGLGVGVRCTDTDKPGNLYAATPDKKNLRGRFWIRPRGSDKATDSARELTTLLPVKLVDLGTRTEALAGWRQRVKQKATESEEERNP